MTGPRRLAGQSQPTRVYVCSCGGRCMYAMYNLDTSTYNYLFAKTTCRESYWSRGPETNHVPGGRCTNGRIDLT